MKWGGQRCPPKVLFDRRYGLLRSKKEKMRISEDIFGWIESLVLAVVILVIVNSFILRTTGVTGQSMEPTLEDKDYLVVSKLFYKEPKQGDVVIFYSPQYWDEVLVKRVIGTPGDVVDIDYATGNVSVNGKVLDEPYIKERIRFQDDVQMPFTVPENCVFVMGDNRNHSTDSRSTTVGAVPYDSIIGKVLFRIFPFNKIGTVK